MGGVAEKAFVEETLSGKRNYLLTQVPERTSAVVS
jgi:hypothetical protein